MPDMRLIQGDALAVLQGLPDCSVHCCVTSPPYWGLRDYDVDGQIGLEDTLAEFIAKLVAVFREVRRVLRDDGTCWVNIGDSYAGSGATGGTNSLQGAAKRKGAMHGRTPPRPALCKAKDLIGQPWTLAFALRADGWYLRQDIIWHKPNPMPESVTDRCTKAHEYLFLLTKSARYYYDVDLIREPLEASSVKRLSQDVAAQRGSERAHAGGKTNGNMKAVQSRGMRRTDQEAYGLTRGTGNPSCIHEDGANKRSVWTVTTKGYSEAHFATFPPKLIEPCVKAGCPKGGTVLDPFNGSGTTGQVALELGCNYIGIELNPEYLEMTRRRLQPLIDQRRMF